MFKSKDDNSPVARRKSFPNFPMFFAPLGKYNIHLPGKNLPLQKEEHFPSSKDKKFLRWRHQKIPFQHRFFSPFLKVLVWLFTYVNDQEQKLFFPFLNFYSKSRQRSSVNSIFLNIYSRCMILNCSWSATWDLENWKNLNITSLPCIELNLVSLFQNAYRLEKIMDVWG